jgi:hypothetical protein
VTENPQGQSVVAGTLAVLNVAANGSNPVSYQWYQDGIAFYLKKIKDPTL